MKKVIYPILSATVFFLASCGGNETKTEDTNAVVEETPVVEEITNDGSTAQYDAEAGKNLYNSSGCVACHQLDVKTVGPSVKEVAAAYADNRDGLIAFLKGEADPIIDPAQEAVMSPQLEITKKLPAADLQNMVEYILSNK
jgi:cytochrome c